MQNSPEIGSEVLQGTPLTTIEHEKLSTLRELVHDVQRAAGRFILSASIAMTGGIGLSTVKESLSSDQANAATATYPWDNAACEFGDAGGATCMNPNDRADLYDWYLDENGNGKFDGNACGGSNASGECFDNFGYQYRNCTSYAAWRANNEFGVSVSGWGNAATWDDSARRAGYAVDVNGPEPGDLAVWDNTYFGHVAFVESVNSDGTVNVAEYNKAGTGRGGIRQGVKAMHYIDINGEGKSWQGSPQTPSNPQAPNGKVPYDAIAEGQEFYSDEGWVYTRAGNAAWPIKHKNNWTATDKSTWGGDPVGPVDTRQTHDHEAGYTIDGQRSYGAHPAQQGTAVYEGNNPQQWYFYHGRAYPITVGEIDDLGVRNRALHIPEGRLNDFKGGNIPFDNGSLYRFAGTNRVNQIVEQPGGYELSYHVNNETVLSCIELSQSKHLEIIPQSARNNGIGRYGTSEISTPAICNFPSGMVLLGPGGVEQWRITGDNRNQGYERHYFPNDLITYLHTAGNPQYALMRSVAALNNAPQGANMGVPNGQFFMDASNGDVFKAENNDFRKVTSPDMLACIGNPPTFKIPRSVLGTMHQGQPLECAFENRILQAPDGKAYYVEHGKRHPIGNTAIRDCISIRNGAGGAAGVSSDAINGFTPNTPAHCTYENEPGLNFVQESGDTTVWLVNPDGTKRHVGRNCVVDPYTTPQKKFHIFTVPKGETGGHVQTSDFFGDPSNCNQLPG